jgi:DNA-binding transcriptional MerR regulator
MSPNNQIGISAVARAVGLSEGLVRRLADRGTIESTRDYGNRRVFDASVIDVLKARSKRIKAKRRANATA